MSLSYNTCKRTSMQRRGHSTLSYTYGALCFVIICVDLSPIYVPYIHCVPMPLQKFMNCIGIILFSEPEGTLLSGSKQCYSYECRQIYAASGFLGPCHTPSIYVNPRHGEQPQAPMQRALLWASQHGATDNVIYDDTTYMDHVFHHYATPRQPSHAPQRHHANTKPPHEFTSNLSNNCYYL